MLQRLSGPTNFIKPGAVVRGVLIGARRMLEPSPSGVASPTAALISALDRIRPNMWMPVAVGGCRLSNLCCHLSQPGLAAWVELPSSSPLRASRRTMRLAATATDYSPHCTALRQLTCIRCQVYSLWSCPRVEHGV